MSVCYFVQSHRDAEQIYRLVRVLRAGSPDATIVVQHNAVLFELDWRPLAALPGVRRFLARGPQLRSDFSCQVEPYLDVIGWLDREGIEYEWLVNLTAQDYPVQPIADIEAFLRWSSAEGYLRWWDALGPESPWSRRKARARYWHRYWRLPDRFEPRLRALRFLTAVLPVHFYLVYGPWAGVRRLRTPFRDGFRCHGGWAWFTLRRHVARYLCDFLREHPEVEAHYRRTVIPEESLVPTILANAHRFRLVNDDLRYIDYSRAAAGSPRVLTTADLPTLAGGRFHFARKFDLGVDREVLDRIDAELLGVGSHAHAGSPAGRRAQGRRMGSSAELEHPGPQAGSRGGAAWTSTTLP
jgi:hypothetical protein